ncbi:MAG: GNAT family N-acetyltransferase [Roseiflexaceae bacterium]
MCNKSASHNVRLKIIFDDARIASLFRLAITRITHIPGLHDKNKTTPYIQNICVAECFQGQGIGSQLITNTTHDTHTHRHQLIVLDVSLDNPRAQKLYE